MNSLLDRIQSPADLKKLNAEEMDRLAGEIREFLIQTVSSTGGHLAPSLGVVELTLALHAVFDSPRDKIVWDVGHQAYVHKILTGRRDRFHTLRQYQGISGFPKMTESEHDAFGTGHASTAISAALGLVSARDILKEDFKVIAVVGDGALTGGLAFEGLNNAGDAKRDLIVVLNDNRMSISPNVGALSRHLTNIITAPLYNRIKDLLWAWTGKMQKGSRQIRSVIHHIEEGLKTMMLPGSLFERLGFRYFGPLDGHNIPQLLRVFQEIKRLHGPVLIHLVTTKGKGYRFAEENAIKFHGLSSFCPETGDTAVNKKPTYTESFGGAMVELAEKDDRIVGITAAMADGTGLIRFADRFPERFFDVGIAEGHAVTFAAALSVQGLRPVVAIYSTFLQRAFDQIIHDVALQKLPVVFAIDRAGLVGEDGPTHHGSFDLSYLRLVPDMVIMAPKDGNELRNMLFTALRHEKGPVAIRYPRGETSGPLDQNVFKTIPMGKGEIVHEGQDAAVLAIGQTVHAAMQAANALSQKGVFVRVVNARFVKPVDRDLILDTAKRFSILLTVEDNTVTGGFGDAVADVLSEAHLLSDVHLVKVGIPDRFIQHGNLGSLHSEIGLDEGHLVQKIEQLLYLHRQNKKSLSSAK
jgi:1-deoxy-D-xylulose-5-phosphate synthase